MTISSTTRTAGPFTGNNVTTTFAFTFKVFAASDLQLVRTSTSTGVSTTLVITTDYTVALNADQNSAPGGSVTLTSALATGYALIITSDIAALQATDLTNQGGFYPQVVTNALDKLTILTQQILNRVGRSLQFPISDSGYNATLPTKAQRLGRVLAFDTTTGDPAPGPTIADVGTVGAIVSDIETVADNITAIQNAASNAASAASSASSASTSASSASTSAASALSSLNTFKGQYYGALASDPTVDPLGAAMTAGDLYFNSTSNRMRSYSGSAWVDYEAAAVSAAATATTQAGLATTNGAAQVALATTQANTSTTQAGISTAQATISTTQAGLAAAAKTLAESARDAALIQSGVYSTEALGRAAVADGVAFKVQGSGDVAAYEYRRTNSTTSVLIATYPSASNVADIGSRISKTQNSKYDLVFTDSNRRIAAAFLKDGGFSVAELKAISAIGGDYSPTSVKIGGAKLRNQTSSDYLITVSDAAGRIALGIKNNGELFVGKITALESNINSLTFEQIGSYFGLFPISTTVAYAIGDSTVAAYAGGTAILDLVTSNRIKNSLAVPGQTIAQQKAVWQATSITPSSVGWVIVQIGLNDLDPSEAASVAIARLQDLVNTIRTTIGSNKPLLISKMIPCRQRLINIYGSTNGLVSYQKWLDMNAAIAGSGATPVTGVDGRITSHEPLMNDGSGNLKAIYDTGDGIHPNTAGRQINATAWANSLQSTRITP